MCKGQNAAVFQKGWQDLSDKKFQVFNIWKHSIWFINLRITKQSLISCSENQVHFVFYNITTFDFFQKTQFLIKVQISLINKTYKKSGRPNRLSLHKIYEFLIVLRVKTLERKVIYEYSKAPEVKWWNISSLSTSRFVYKGKKLVA